ncbi:EAL domain-containing protein [Robertmurraya massiliosenegalensis]|uniref:EAL domain-containing protein n=1 Tax=Robertmurraya TaxID=2837507 RepID=UPI0039A43843
MKLYFLTIFNSEIIVLIALCFILLFKLGKILYKKNPFTDKRFNKFAYHSLLQHNPDAVLILDGDAKIKGGNEAVQHVFGYHYDELKEQTFINLVEKKNHLSFFSQLDDALIGISKESTVHGYHKNGKLLRLSLKCVPLVNKKNSFGVFVIVQNLTENESLKVTLHDTNERLTSFLNNTADAINITNTNSEVLYVNPSFEKMYGWSQEEIKGKPLPLIPEHLSEEEETYRKSLIAGQSITNWEDKMLRKDGTLIDVNISISPLKDENGAVKGFAAITRDISEKKQYEEKLEQLAYYDPLTGVANRRLFKRRLETTISDAKEGNKKFALLFLDCDRFKWVNDTMGHDVGDELLQNFAKRIQNVLRTTDSLCRLGGDEFAIILPEIHSKEEVTRVVERIIESLQTPWSIQDHHFITTCSIGISMFPIHGEDNPTLLSHADQALYQAKENGRNSYKFFTLELESEINRMMLLENDIKHAIKAGHFYLVYQPQVNLYTEKTECLEVLLRYQHPALGNIPPDEFIPICEKTGLIDDITVWIIKQVGLQYKKWMDNGYNSIKFAINISPVSLQNAQYTDKLIMAIYNSRIPPHLLELEVTELAFLENLEETQLRLNEIKTLGVNISLDDFCSGYSSMIYFKHLPIDKIKLDKTFIQGVHSKDGKKDQAILKAIFSLAKELDLNIICEGVETKEQALYLLKNNLIFVQGNYFSKPVSSMELENAGFLEDKDVRMSLS